MKTKKTVVSRSARTGSYTVKVPKSAVTGKFVSTAPKRGSIQISGQKKKAA